MEMHRQVGLLILFTLFTLVSSVLIYSTNTSDITYYKLHWHVKHVISCIAGKFDTSGTPSN